MRWPWRKNPDIDEALAGSARRLAETKQQQANLVDSGLDGIDLGQDVDAVGFLIDHPRDAADLSLDAMQSCLERFQVLRITRFHCSEIIPQGGMGGG